MPRNDHRNLRTLYQNPLEFESNRPQAYNFAKRRVDTVVTEVIRSSKGLKGPFVVIADIDRGITSNGEKSFLNYLRGVPANSYEELQTGLSLILEAIGKDINPRFLSKIASIGNGDKRVRRSR